VLSPFQNFGNGLLHFQECVYCGNPSPLLSHPHKQRTPINTQFFKDSRPDFYLYTTIFKSPPFLKKQGEKTAPKEPAAGFFVP